MVEMASKRAADLRRAINTHDRNYYVLDSSSISDSEYDSLIQELREIESNYPQ